MRYRYTPATPRQSPTCFGCLEAACLTPPPPSAPRPQAACSQVRSSARSLLTRALSADRDETEEPAPACWLDCICRGAGRNRASQPELRRQRPESVWKTRLACLGSRRGRTRPPLSHSPQTARRPPRRHGTGEIAQLLAWHDPPPRPAPPPTHRRAGRVPRRQEPAAVRIHRTAPSTVTPQRTVALVQTSYCVVPRSVCTFMLPKAPRARPGPTSSTPAGWSWLRQAAELVGWLWTGSEWRHGAGFVPGCRR